MLVSRAVSPVYLLVVGLCTRPALNTRPKIGEEEAHHKIVEDQGRVGDLSKLALGARNETTVEIGETTLCCCRTELLVRGSHLEESSKGNFESGVAQRWEMKADASALAIFETETPPPPPELTEEARQAKAEAFHARTEAVRTEGGDPLAVLASLKAQPEDARKVYSLTAETIKGQITFNGDNRFEDCKKYGNAPTVSVRQEIDRGGDVYINYCISKKFGMGSWQGPSKCRKDNEKACAATDGKCPDDMCTPTSEFDQELALQVGKIQINEAWSDADVFCQK